MTSPAQSADGPPLPEMREASLSNEDVRALVNDLRALTIIRGTLCKTKLREQTSATDTPLEAAIDQLLARSIPAVQIHYLYDGYNWTDTLLNTPTGIRLVRCRHESSRSGLVET